MGTSAKLRRGLVIVVGVAVALTACAPTAVQPGDETSEAPAQREVVVGVVTSETGEAAVSAQQYLEGFAAGLAYATGGSGQVNGITIAAEHRDDTGDPDTAATLAEELIGDGVNILVGSATSDVALAVAEQAAQHEVLFISGAAVADTITGINDYTFRSGHQFVQEVAAAGTFLDDLSGTRVMVYSQYTERGHAYETAVREILGGAGAEVGALLAVEGVAEFTMFAQELIADQPDLVIVAWQGSDAPQMWQALHQEGVFEQTQVVSTLGEAPTIDDYGEAAEHISFVTHYVANAPDNAVNTAMLDAVTAAGGTPGPATPDGFNAALMLTHAIGEAGDDVDGLIRALEGYTFDGPTGETTVRASDHALVQEMYQVRLTAEGDTFVPELVAAIPGDEVAPAEAR